MARFSLILLATSTLSAAVLSGGCQAPPQSSEPEDVVLSPPSRQDPGVDRCALSDRPLGEVPATRLFAGESIRFRSEAEATTFDDLPGGRKRVLAGQQVLARRGVANAFCPVSQKPLPIDASVVTFENVKIAFVSRVELEQFEGLPREVQIRMVARHLLRSRGIPNERCPISDGILLPNSPSIEVRGVRIAFADQSNLEAFRTLPSARRNEIVARILMPERGISNLTCPITQKPIRMDSPVVVVDGQAIALRNVQAARAFNDLPEEARRAMVMGSD